MRRQYDDFTQLKIKDMSKAMSDMTYKYVDPEINRPTLVPASHYEKILGEIKEQYMSDITSMQFLNIMYNQLNALKQEDEKYFQQAMLCIDLKIKPSDLRLNERISLSMTQEMIEQRKQIEKKDFHLLDSDIINYYEDVKNDSSLHAEILKTTEENEYHQDNIFNNRLKHTDFER